jgi:parallel beta-helix repeat protein
MGRSAIAIRNVGVAAATLLCLAGVAPAAAQVRCGDVIGPNETVVLQGSVDNCGPGPAAVTVIGPATLDLNGFSVSCLPSGSETADGIVLVGKRVTLRNGTVQLCSTGVRVLGDGSHRIERVTAATSDGREDDGFRIESDSNRLIENVALQNGNIGFVIFGNRNRLTDNRAFFNAGVGFAIFFTSRNTLRGNLASGNSADGFRLSAGSRNSLVENTAVDNEVGINASDEVGLRLTANVARGNREDGIEFLFGSESRLLQNRVEDNAEHGIVVGGSAQILVSRNTSLNNDRGDNENPRFDLVDIGQPNCGTNRWRGNVFVTSSPSCVQ